MGVRWLGLDALGTSGGTYGIHGTNNPKSIGKYVSAGCIRMHNKDVIWLYQNTSINTPVEIINREWELEQRPIKIMVNGKQLIQDAASRAYMVKNRVMVPSRLVAESMGCNVTWDESRKMVTITKENKAMSATVNSSAIYVNSELRHMDVTAVFKNDRVYLPVRYVAEVFGYNINWNNNTYTVLLTGNE